MRQAALWGSGEVVNQSVGWSVSPMMTFGPMDEYLPMDFNRRTTPVLK
ncbi:hypothetical protein TI01_0898 [Lysobacter sp. A03]|nr:hypothetical protein TI01_0898 [Lysobacter sp. A03]